MDTGSILTYLIAGIAFLGLIAVLLVIFGAKKKGGGGKRSGVQNTNKNQAQLIKEATKKLAKKPDNIEALQTLGQVYYESKIWDKALPAYKELARLSGLHPEIVAADMFLRAGICLFQMGQLEEAQKELQQAYLIDTHGYEVNYYLGLVYARLNAYDKALPCLKKALIANPEAVGVYKLIGSCLFNQHHYRESLQFLKKALAENPADKESLFLFADAMTEDGHGEKAVKIFGHLRPDPVYGPKSCLRAGVYHMNQGDVATAMQDFQIGLKLKNIPQDIALELKYKLALAYFNQSRISDGLTLLRQIKEVNQNYKDINTLIARYAELSSNTNLQIYLSGSVGDFVVLCRKMVSNFDKNSIIKIMDVQVTNGCTDIVTEMDTPRGKLNAVFRFFRNTGVTGELYVREFHDSLRDKSQSLGVCITAGTFSDDAKRFADGRPLDLIERDRLNKMLKRVG